MQTIGQLVITGIEFLSIWALFDRFKSLQGWSLPEVGLLYGFISIVFTLADASSKGFDLIPSLIRSGEFDRVLLRPISPLLQIAGREFTLRRMGRLLQGLIIFFWACSQISFPWTFLKILLLIYVSICGFALFIGIFILQATLCFWTVESVEFGNILTYGGVETTEMPLSIYPKNFQRFFTYIVPLGCIAYYPMLIVMGKADPSGSGVLFQILSPLLGFLFFLVSLKFWQVGLYHYHSAGG